MCWDNDCTQREREKRLHNKKIVFVRLSLSLKPNKRHTHNRHEHPVVVKNAWYDTLTDREREREKEI